MKNDTTGLALPSLTADLLQPGTGWVDNLMADLWQEVGMKTLLSRAGFRKRSGTPVHDLVYVLVVWVWLKVDSIGLFARESLMTFTTARKDALYDLMNREDLNWRRLQQEVADRALRQMPSTPGPKALVVDDTLKPRSGKKMPGVSSHFDHTVGRHRMGQQVLQLGLASEAGFVPLDEELFISQVKAQGLHEPFQEGRSVVAKRYRVALGQTKLEMAEAMLKRALRRGVTADYLLADAWFGCKAFVQLAEDQSLTGIFRMKKGQLHYRFSEYRDGQWIRHSLKATELYQRCVRQQWERWSGFPYQVKSVEVEVNLAVDAKAPERWRKVRLLFVRGLAQGEKKQVGKHDYAVFLSTDPSLAPKDILKIYALRWTIEVYFKEIKQHLGFLKEQSRHYAAYLASIHLAAIRFCLLLMARLIRGLTLPQARNALIAQIMTGHFAHQVWPVFQALIEGALDELRSWLGDALADQVLETIQRHVERFFAQALQLDARTLRLEAA